MSLPNLVNVRTDEFDVYIGRPVPRAKDERCRVGSLWGNPYAGPVFWAKEPKKWCVEMYATLLRNRLLVGGRVPHWHVHRCGYDYMDAAWWGEQLDLLRGKRLGCWCSPEPCHGDAIIEAVKRRMEGESQ